MAPTARPNRRTPPRHIVADRLHSAAVHLLRRLRQADEQTGLSPAKLSALSVVVFAGPVRLGELAAAEQVRPPTVTVLVRALEADGLVRRVVDRRDRRAACIHATAKGRRLLMRGRSARVKLLTRLLAKLDRTEIAVVHHATRAIEASLRDTGPA